MVYSPPDHYRHDPAIVAAQVKSQEPFGFVNHIIYADGRCSCVAYKLRGNCCHARFATPYVEGQSGGPVTAWLDSQPYGEPLPEPRVVEIHYERPFWVKCDCMGAELGNLPAEDHDEDCPFYVPAAVGEQTLDSLIGQLQTLQG